MRQVRAKPLKPADYILLALVVAILLWAFIPGIGPNLAHLGGDTAEQLGIGGEKTADLLAHSPQTSLIKGISALPEGNWIKQPRYQRSAFGPAWADVDHNGCDTRNDVLNRDLKQVQHRGGTGGCLVQSGILQDPYTGKQINFHRGKNSSEAIQIDHVVALHNAWRTGAAQWSPEERLQYANDPLVLLAVDGPANQEKSDKDASEWLPANSGFQCQYVALQVAIKLKYKLWVTPAEKHKMAQVASLCPNQQIPAY